MLGKHCNPEAHSQTLEVSLEISKVDGKSHLNLNTLFKENFNF